MDKNDKPKDEPTRIPLDVVADPQEDDEDRQAS